MSGVQSVTHVSPLGLVSYGEYVQGDGLKYPEGWVEIHEASLGLGLELTLFCE